MIKLAISCHLWRIPVSLITRWWFFMSDHGEMLGDHGLLYKGCRFYEEESGCLWFSSWPKRFQSGTKASGLVELIDIAPTLLDLAGLPAPGHMQGRSLAPILSGAGRSASISGSSPVAKATTQSPITIGRENRATERCCAPIATSLSFTTVTIWENCTTWPRMRVNSIIYGTIRGARN